MSPATARAARQVPSSRPRGARRIATADRLIDAAESLFAERGFEGTSMRALADRAGAGVSAANYHFGGKIGIIRAVVERRLAPINARRLADLGALERRCAPARPSVEAVLESFLRPSFDAWLEDEARSGQGGRHIEARLHTDPHPMLAELKERLCRPTVERYVDCLEGSLPEQSRDALRVGVELVSGLLVHVVGGRVSLDAQPTAASEPIAPEHLFECVVAFSAAGLRAVPRLKATDAHALAHTEGV